MKKIFPYILILVVLMGLFSPGFNVQAAIGDACTIPGTTPPKQGTIQQGGRGPTCVQTTPTTASAIGTCTYSSTSGNPPQTFTYKPRETKTICENRPQPRSWVADPVMPPGGPIGTCKFSFGKIAKEEQTTKAICAGKEPPGQWTANPSPVAPVDLNYVLLAPLPCQEGTPGCVKNDKGNFELKTFDPTSSKDNNAFGSYLNTMIKIIIGLCAVLAMVMIVMGGIQYMTSELISGKEAGRERLNNAILGLLLALGAYALLFTINPNLLKTDLGSLEDVTVTVNLQDLGGESPDPFVAISKERLQALGITNCTGAGGKEAIARIGQQFIGKTVWSMEAGKRNTINSSKVTLDCSAFVAQVYNCARVASPGGTTAAIFSSGNTRAVTGATTDFSKLNPGDLVGWKKDDNGSGQKVEGTGHVMIYLGDGKVLHSSSTSGGVTVSNLSDYQARITYVKWP